MWLWTLIATAGACEHPAACWVGCDGGDLDDCLVLADMLDDDEHFGRTLEAEALAQTLCDAGTERACPLSARLRIRREARRGLYNRPYAPAPAAVELPYVAPCAAGDLVACTVVEAAHEFGDAARQARARSVLLEGLAAVAERDPELCHAPALFVAPEHRNDPTRVAAAMQACRRPGREAIWSRFVGRGSLDGTGVDWAARGVGDTALAERLARVWSAGEWVDAAQALEADAAIWRADTAACAADPRGFPCMDGLARAAERAMSCPRAYGEDTCAQQSLDQLQSLCLAGVDAACGMPERIQRPTPPCDDEPSCLAAAVRAWAGRDDTYRFEARCAAGEATVCTFLAAIGSPSDAVRAWSCAQGPVGKGLDGACRPPAASLVDVLRACDVDGDPDACTTTAVWLADRGSGVRSARRMDRGCRAGWHEGCRRLAARLEAEPAWGGAAAALELYDDACEAGDWESCREAASRRPDPHAGLERALAAATSACGVDDLEACGFAVGALEDRGERRQAAALRGRLRADAERACGGGEIATCRWLHAHGADRVPGWRGSVDLGLDGDWLGLADRASAKRCRKGGCDEALAWSLERERVLCEGDSRCIADARALRASLCDRGEALACGGPARDADRRACATGEARPCLRLAMGALARGEDLGIDALDRACDAGAAEACALAAAMGLRPEAPDAPCADLAACEARCATGDGDACERAERWDLGKEAHTRADALRRAGCDAGHAPSCYGWFEDGDREVVRPRAAQLCEAGDPVGCLWAESLHDEAQRAPWTDRFRTLAEAACAGGDRGACASAAVAGGDPTSFARPALERLRADCVAGERAACGQLLWVKREGKLDDEGWVLHPRTPRFTSLLGRVRLDVGTDFPLPVDAFAAIADDRHRACSAASPIACREHANATLALERACAALGWTQRADLPACRAHQARQFARLCDRGLVVACEEPSLLESAASCSAGDPAACVRAEWRAMRLGVHPARGMHALCGDGNVEACRVEAWFGWSSGSSSPAERHAWQVRADRAACAAGDAIACALLPIDERGVD